MATEVVEPIPERTDEKKFIRNWAYLRLAHEALMLKRVKENAKKVERLENFAASGDKADLKATATSDDSDEMNIGNEIHNHYQGTDTTTATTTSTPTKAIGTLGSMALGAALMTGGGGVGYTIYDMVTNNEPPAVTAPSTDTDTDTIIDVTFPQ